MMFDGASPVDDAIVGGTEDCFFAHCSFISVCDWFEYIKLFDFSGSNNLFDVLCSFSIVFALLLKILCNTLAV
jgi:hypothetical protein